MARQNKVARSIIFAILKGDHKHARSVLARIFAAFAAFFALWELSLKRVRNDLFGDLRSESWQMDEDDYETSFQTGDDDPMEDALKSTADMGFSGSTFFNTADERFIVKSVPRSFEHTFFRDDLLEPYVEHMQQQQKSLLIRITDFLACKNASLGGWLGLAPSHHIVMENLLYGKAEAKSKGGDQWETFDLKPTSYFFPERDIAGGMLSSEATKSRLADKFEDKIVLSSHQADEFLGQLEIDTKLLEQCNAVDYSLFLVRIPKEIEDPFADGDGDDNGPGDGNGESVAVVLPQVPPFVPPSPPSWRTGVVSTDDKYIFRATILDFFWAKHKVFPQLMTLLIKGWNIFNSQGPMSITTTSSEYRTRFLEMCRDMIEIKD